VRPAAYLRSKPAQNAPPAPHGTATDCDPSASKASSASVSASALAGSMAPRAARRSRISAVTGPSCSMAKFVAISCRAGCGIGRFRICRRLTCGRLANCDIPATPKRGGAVAHQAMRRNDAKPLVLLGVGEAFVAGEPAQRVDLGVPLKPAHERRARLRDPAQLHDALGRHAGEAAGGRRLDHELALEHHDRGAPAWVGADRNRQPMPMGIAERACIDVRHPRMGGRGAFA
jgi:hypothetical protein